MLTILIGMSASGKDAILRELVANHGFREIVTTTTRPMRKGEVNGKDYNFISRKEFEKGASLRDDSLSIVLTTLSGTARKMSGIMALQRCS